MAASSASKGSDGRSDDLVYTYSQPYDQRMGAAAVAMPALQCQCQPHLGADVGSATGDTTHAPPGTPHLTLFTFTNSPQDKWGRTQAHIIVTLLPPLADALPRDTLRTSELPGYLERCAQQLLKYFMDAISRG